MDIDEMNDIARSVDESGIDLNKILIEIAQEHKERRVQMLAAIIRGLVLAREHDISYQLEQRERQRERE